MGKNSCPLLASLFTVFDWFGIVAELCFLFSLDLPAAFIGDLLYQVVPHHFDTKACFND